MTPRASERCLHYAGLNGYCRFHQPAEDQASEEDDPRYG